MTTEFTKSISREMKLKDEFGREGEVIVTMHSWGMEFRKKGTSRKLNVTWDKIAKQIQIPAHAPSKFVQNPFGWVVDL